MSKVTERVAKAIEAEATLYPDGMITNPRQVAKAAMLALRELPEDMIRAGSSYPAELLLGASVTFRNIIDAALSELPANTESDGQV